MDHAEVAGMEPAAGEGFCGRGAVLDIAFHHDVAAAIFAQRLAVGGTRSSSRAPSRQIPRAPVENSQGIRYVALEGLTVMEPETMTEVPADGETLGEVMFRGNIVMKGYLKNRTATAEAFAGGWFNSGDLGVMHPDGYIQLKDRSKDIIISGGENISSIEVEEVLYRHPSVAFCAVVAKPDEKWGETPCAFIELKPGATSTAEDIIAWCRSGLARSRFRATLFCRSAENLDRQNPEIQAARDGERGVSSLRGARAVTTCRSFR